MAPQSKHGLSYMERRVLYLPYQREGRGYKWTCSRLRERGVDIPVNTVKSDWRTMKLEE